MARLNWLHNGFGRVHNDHSACIIFGFAHLGRGIGQAHDPGTNLRHKGSGILNTSP